MYLSVCMSLCVCVCKSGSMSVDVFECLRLFAFVQVGV